ncbi:Extracellular tyrosine-protein kinase PKDCC, partial [Lamprotornis superbus]
TPASSRYGGRAGAGGAAGGPAKARQGGGIGAGAHAVPGRPRSAGVGSGIAPTLASALPQLHGQCYDNSGDAELRVTAMLELGSPLEMIQLLQTPWEERFKICLSLVKLLFYLAHSPLGSIVLLDFQPRQFVMVDGNLKVTDMDDASTEELSCKEDNDCTLDFPTKSFPLKCSVVGKCEGINEKKNLFNAYRYFFTYLLPHSAPPTLRPLLSDILNATGDLRYGINETLRAFEKVLHLYKSGLYLQKRPLLLKDYISLKGFRTVEGEGYKCWPSYSHLGCLLSIHNAEEAAAICNSQLQCQSFIITQHRTWTGRPLASFQSSWTDLIPDANAVVYIKHCSEQLVNPKFQAAHTWLSSCHSMLMEKPRPVMPPGRGRMVCKASLRMTLQDVTEAVKGAATLRQRRWTQHPPCHSTSQHCPDSSPARDKAVAADSGQALLGSVPGTRVDAPHVGGQPTHGCLSGSMHGNRAPAPTELGVGGTGTSSPCFDIFPAHDLKDHCPRAESDGDVLRKATANIDSKTKQSGSICPFVMVFTRGQSLALQSDRPVKPHTLGVTLTLWVFASMLPTAMAESCAVLKPHPNPRALQGSHLPSPYEFVAELDIKHQMPQGSLKKNLSWWIKAPEA